MYSQPAPPGHTGAAVAFEVAEPVPSIALTSLAQLFLLEEEPPLFCEDPPPPSTHIT